MRLFTKPSQFLFNVLIIVLLSTGAVKAELLPHPANVMISGDVLQWDAVENAEGYNIYLNYSYIDTVKNTEEYALTQAGIYWVVAFDDMGNFGSQYGYDDDGNDITVNYDGNTNSDLSINSNGLTAIVQNTCKDVGPGESCLAVCPRSVDYYSSTRYISYMSGGACSTSDIVEADAFISPRTYKCTVPTFSGEVIAQAICVIR